MNPVPDEKAQLSRYLFIIRGIAIILVVAGHVIGYDKNFGMRQLYASDLGWLGKACDVFNTVHMPIFFMASGIAFMLFSRKDTDFKTFIVSKFSKLLIPLIIYAPIYFVFQHLAKRESFTALEVLYSVIIPFEKYSGIFWFIHYLLYCTLISYLCFRFLKSKAAYLMISAALMVPYLYLHHRELDWFDSVAYWNFFFAFGVLIAEPLLGLRSRLEKLPLVVLPVFEALLMAVMIAMCFYRVPEIARFERFVNGPTGFLFLFILINFAGRVFSGAAFAEKTGSALGYLGATSLVVYLFHGYFTRGTAILFQKVLGLPNPSVYFIVLTGIGVLGPLVLDYFLQPRSAWYAWSIGANKKSRAS